MKKRIILIAVIGLFLLMLPLLVANAETSNTIIYNQTYGNPTGGPEEMTYSFFSDNPQETRGKVYRLYCQSLDNDYTRFTLEFTAVEGLTISVFNPPQGDVFKYYDNRKATAFGKNTLQFDVSNGNLRKAFWTTIAFWTKNDEFAFGVDFNPRQTKQFNLNLSGGSPAGNPENIHYNFRIENQKGNGSQVHSVLRQRLNNGYTRFIVEFTVPERLAINYFNPPNGDVIVHASEVTSSGRSTLQFDVGNDQLQAISKIVIVFRDYAKIYGDDTFFITMDFDPNESVSAVANGLHADADGVWRYYENGQFVALNQVVEYNGQLVFLSDGELFQDSGLWRYNDDVGNQDGNIYLLDNGIVQTQYTGLYQGVTNWFLVQNGIVNENYNGLYYDPNYGWWLIQDGRIAWDYTGLYCDANVGWWLISGGTIAWDYNGLWNDPNYGWWLIQGGQIAWNYTGNWEDPVCGTWYISGGCLAGPAQVSLNGLSCDVDGVWRLYDNGTFVSGYTGLYCDATVGWWLIRNGEIAWDYTGLWCDPIYGWWLIGGGHLANDYNGLWCDPVCGWWLINGGTINWGYTGGYDEFGATWNIVNGQLIF